jgi:hypothetical protein
VRLLDKRQNVIRVETAIDGHIWKGWGQLWLALRKNA